MHTQTGTIKRISPLKQGTSKSGKDYAMRELVIQTDEKYQKILGLTAFGERAEALDSFEVGQVVNVKYKVSSREYEHEGYFKISHNVTLASIEAIPTYMPEPQFRKAQGQQMQPLGAPSPNDLSI